MEQFASPAKCEFSNRVENEASYHVYSAFTLETY